MSNILEEYLVKIGFDVKNNGEAQRAVNTINGITDSLGKLGTVLRMGGIAALFAKVTDSIVENIKSVAKADMEYQKLAQDMWVTKDTAKALSVVLKTIGASEKDVAWVPELREQFFRLRQEMNELATPVDADNQLKWIRSIGYDIQSLQLKFQMLKEWVVYYLIKYMEPMIKQFKEFIGWLNNKLGQNMPSIAKKIAEWLSNFMKLVATGFRLVKNVFGWLWEAFQNLPSRIKALVPAFAAAGALIMAGPFGLMLTAIGGALILLEDFFTYLDGGESSKTFTPMWKWLKEFSEGTGSNFLNSITGALGEVYKALEQIFTGIDYESVFAEWNKSLKSIGAGLDHLLDSLGKILKKFDSGSPTAKSFFVNLGKYIGLALRTFGRLAGSLGAVMESLARALDGDFKGAAAVLGIYMKDLVTGTFKDVKSTFLDSAGNPNSVTKAQQIVANPGADFLGNANGCTFFVQGALGKDDDFMKEVGGSLWVPTWVEKAKEMKRYHEGTEGMQAGDIIVYDYGQGDGFGDHVVLSDGKGGAYGNSTENQAPMYYPDMNVISGRNGRIAGYIRPGTQVPSYASEQAYANASTSEYAGAGGYFGSNEYNYGGFSIGALTINISAPSGDGKAIAASVSEAIYGMKDRVLAHNAGGPYK